MGFVVVMVVVVVLLPLGDGPAAPAAAVLFIDSPAAFPALAMGDLPGDRPGTAVAPPGVKP